MSLMLWTELLFWFGSYLCMGIKCRGCGCKRKERGHGEGKEEVLRTVRTNGLCGFIATSVPTLGFVSIISYVNFPLSKIRLVSSFVSCTLCVLGRWRSWLMHRVPGAGGGNGGRRHKAGGQTMAACKARVCGLVFILLTWLTV